MIVLTIVGVIATILFILSLIMFITKGNYTVDHSLTGQTYLITGASSGIGKYTALELAANGAELYLACRNVEKAKRVVEEIKKATGNEKLHIVELDLLDLKSVRKCAEEIKSQTKTLNVLINNAGIGYDGQPERRLTKDGLEEIMAANYYGHFLLTNLLLDLIEKSAPSRIVNLSSFGHWFHKFSNNDFNLEKGNYSRIRAYCLSKLAMNLFSKVLGKKLKETGVTVNSVHPGFVSTELFRDAPFFTKIGIKFSEFIGIAKTCEQGACTTLYAATSPNLENVTGKYFADCHKAWESSQARDTNVAQQLFEESLRYVGLA